VASIPGAQPLPNRGSGGLPASLPDAGHDLAAALALAAVAIPEQIATARLAGMPPAVGLMVFIAASFGFFVLGRNRYLSAGADSTIAPIFAAGLTTTAFVGTTVHYPALVALLALLVGVIVFAAGALRLGWIARLLSVPVIIGFLAGISIHILISQLPALFGVAAGQGTLINEVSQLLRNIARPNLLTILIGLGVFAATISCEKIDVRIPGALIAMVVATFCVWLFGLDHKGVAVLGVMVPVQFRPSMPSISLAELGQILPLSLIVALVVIIQTAAVSKSFPCEADDVNRDLVGVGLGNLISAIFGGFPVNSSPPRTAIVSESGGTSRFAGLCAAIAIGFFLIFGLGLLAYVPEAALAGLLLFVAQRIFRFDVMRTVASQSPAEFALLAATAVAIIIMPIDVGVGFGIALSLLHGVWTITQTRTIIFHQVPGTTIWWPAHPGFTGQTRPGVVVVGFQAPLFFLNAETFRKTFDSAVESAQCPVHTIILEASSIMEIDYSGAQILEALIRCWRDRGVSIYIARLESLRAQRAFEKFGILELIGEQRIFHSVDDAMKQIPTN
jgi:SulP family sulfate permease